MGPPYFTFCPERTQRHFLFKAVRMDMWQRQLEDGSLRLIPCGKNHSNLLAHMMAVAYFIFCPKEVVLDRGREEEWYTGNDLKGCPFCRRPLDSMMPFSWVLRLHLHFRGFTF